MSGEANKATEQKVNIELSRIDKIEERNNVKRQERFVDHAISFGSADLLIRPAQSRRSHSQGLNDRDVG